MFQETTIQRMEPVNDLVCLGVNTTPEAQFEVMAARRLAEAVPET